MDTSTRSKNHEIGDFLVFWKMNPKSYDSKMKQTTGLLGYSQIRIYSKIACYRPQIQIFPDFHGFPKHNRFIKSLFSQQSPGNIGEAYEGRHFGCLWAEKRGKSYRKSGELPEKIGFGVWGGFLA